MSGYLTKRTKTGMSQKLKRFFIITFDSDKLIRIKSTNTRSITSNKQDSKVIIIGFDDLVGCKEVIRLV